MKIFHIFIIDTDYLFEIIDYKYFVNNDLYPL